MATVTQLTKTQTTQAEDLPTLRKKKPRLLQLCKQGRLNCNDEDEAGRIARDIKKLRPQLSQIAADRTHTRR
ncbi:MAG: hypothetical protein R3D66_02385 [Alphaproteobacteria bacterium]